MATLDDIHYRLGELTGKVGQLVDQMGIHDKRDADMFSDLNVRVTGIEKWQNRAVGAILATSTLSAVVAAIVTWTIETIK